MHVMRIQIHNHYDRDGYHEGGQRYLLLCAHNITYSAPADDIHILALGRFESIRMLGVMDHEILFTNTKHRTVFF